ncbi:MAG: YegP family protein [Kofleriaceae bacterium]|nr:YegP family protein [Kofleriaceae bacterium]
MGSNDERYDRRTSNADQPYFVLKAANGEIIGKSQMYSTGRSASQKNPAPWNRPHFAETATAIAHEVKPCHRALLAIPCSAQAPVE